MVKQRWGCIYRLTNVVTGKKYIGQTLFYRKRMSRHRSRRRGTYLSHAVSKYGWDNFKQEIIIDNIPEEDLDGLEIAYIDVENTMAPHGYNLTEGGGGVRGWKASPERLKQMSELTKKQFSNRKRFGTICYNKQKKKWCAKGPRPERKHIGFFDSEELAKHALDHYNATGDCSEFRRKRERRYGTIQQHGKRYRAAIYVRKKRYYESFDSVEECEIYLKTIKDA